MARINPSGRLHPRAGLDVYVNKIIDDEPHLCRVRDISPTGVFLFKLLEPEMESDAPVGLEIMLPNSLEIIWAVAKPIRAEEGRETDGIAYRFTRIAESDKQLIRDYVALFEESEVARAA